MHVVSKRLRLKSVLQNTIMLLVLVAFGLAQALMLAYAGDPGGGVIRVSSMHQIYEPLTGRTRLLDGVDIDMDNTHIQGGEALIALDDGSPKEVSVSKGASMSRNSGGGNQVIHAQSLNMNLPDNTVRADGHVTTTMNDQDKKGSGENVQITSDSQVFDQKNNLMKAIGKVSVIKGEMTASSPEALILLDSSGGAEKVLFIHGAHLRNSQQEIDAEKITINLKTGDIYAENNVKSHVVTEDQQGKKSEAHVESQLQEIDSDTGMLLANGKAVVQFDDMVAKGPKATFYMENKQLDRIVLNGRAEVEDPDQRVLGDTITITVNPKQFKAQGNVQSFIKAKDNNKTASPQPQQKGKPSGKKSAPASASASKKTQPAVAAAQKSQSASRFANADQELMLEQVGKTGVE